MALVSVILAQIKLLKLMGFKCFLFERDDDSWRTAALAITFLLVFRCFP